MIKIISFNVNGIRAALRKGLRELTKANGADIYCLQEIKADTQALADLESELSPYYCFFFPAQKKGYSGVAILARRQPNKVKMGIDNATYDQEGRVISVEFDTFRLVNLYLPSGSQGAERQAFKEAFMKYLFEYTRLQYLNSPKPLLIAGDFNICHKPIDIHNPEGLKNTSGFLPHEREWFSSYLSLGLLDSFREVNSEPGQYTWWTYRAGAKARNKGWRIDYQLVSQNLAPAIVSHTIHRQVDLSDHCPIELTLDIDF
jgi:exodeoxyribonuclease-3